MSKRVLVVEDDYDIRINLQEILESEGYGVAIAQDGKVALEMLQNETALPSLILLDLMMPVMDGFQFRLHQRQDQRLSEIPIVIMSADGNVGDKKSRLGALEYLRKPIDLDVLLDTVARCSSFDNLSQPASN